MVNQQYSRTDESCSWHEKHHSQPTDVEQIYFYMNSEDVLSVYSDILGVYTDFTLPASIKQAELRGDRGVAIFNFPLPGELGAGWSQNVLNFLYMCHCGTV